MEQTDQLQMVLRQGKRAGHVRTAAARPVVAVDAAGKAGSSVVAEEHSLDPEEVAAVVASEVVEAGTIAAAGVAVVDAGLATIDTLPAADALAAMIVADAGQWAADRLETLVAGHSSLLVDAAMALDQLEDRLRSPKVLVAAEDTD